MAGTSPRSAMVFAAGRGERMRPITERRPKPLIEVGGKALIDHCLDRFAENGVERAVVNVHWLGQQIIDHLQGRESPEIVISDEREKLLDQGGGLKKALPRLGPGPLFVCNTDAFWIEGPVSNLARLVEAFDPEKMDAMLLLARTAGTIAETGSGDFLWPRGGKPKRREERDVAPYLFAGVQIVSPALFADAPPPPFSMNLLWDRAMAADRLDAIVHDGLWFHLSTPDDLARADAMLDAREVGNTT